MKRTRIITILVTVLLIVLFPISAANHLSVPVGHRVYRVLDAGRIRGLYDENLVSVKPYTASKVIALLEEMASRPDRLRAGEIDEIHSILAELDNTYGNNPSGLDQLLSTGYLRFYDSQRKLGASFGITFDTSQSVDLAHINEFDSRNLLKAILRGDIGEHISFNMDFGLAHDFLNPYLYLPNEFNIPGEGFYLNLFKGGGAPGDFPFDMFYSGLTFNPELTASFFDGDVTLRWAAIKRDWGPGANNLLVSSTAKEFDGIEFQLNPTPWFRYAFLSGTLGNYSVRSYKGVPYVFPADYISVEKEDKHRYRFNNNYSAHRVELDITKNLTFALYESVIWQKRFELAYLNPFSIFMFVQNNVGDVDSMFDGLDLTYTLPNKIRLYGSMAVNEMNKVGSLSTILKYPRNMFAFQLGAVVPLPIGTFSTLTAQWTYINPFVYTHYPMMKLTGVLDNVDGTTITTDTGRTVELSGGTLILSGDKFDPGDTITVDTSKEMYDKRGRTRILYDSVKKQYMIYETTAEYLYVNKGQLLGYPLQPNSQEFLLSLDLGFPRGWNAQAEIKYQVRSGQYGFDIWQNMNYKEDDLYPDKDFWNNTFQHTVSVLLAASKQLDNMPITLSASYRFIIDWAQEPTLTRFDGKNTVFGPWEGPIFNHILQVGVKVFY